MNTNLFLKKQSLTGRCKVYYDIIKDDLHTLIPRVLLLAYNISNDSLLSTSTCVEYFVVEVREVIGSSAFSLLRISAMNRALDIWNDEELWNILPVRSGDEDEAVRISVR